MLAILTLSVSIVLQAVALVLALRLIPITRGWTAWLLITAASLLIVVRRVIHLWALLAGFDIVGPSELLESSINLTLSAMLLSGVWFIRPLFVRMIQDREALGQQIEESQTVMAVAPVAIWVAHDPQCHTITGNSAANEFYRVPSDTNVSQTPADGEPPHRLRCFQNGRELAPREFPMQVAAASGKAIRGAEFEIVQPDGARQVALGSVSPLRGPGGEVRGVVGAFLDITEHRRAQDALRKAHDELDARVRERTAELRATVEKLEREMMEHQRTQQALIQSEKKYRALAENTNDVIYVVDVEGRLAYVSPQAKRYGFDPEELVGKTILDVVDPRDRDLVAADFGRTMATGAEFPTVFRVKDASGHEVWFEDMGRADRDVEGKVVGIYGILRDITERKRADEALRTSEEKFAKIFTLAPALMTISVVEGGTYVDVNNAFVVTTGFSREEVIGRTSACLGITVPQDRNGVIEMLRARGTIAGMEMTFHARDGREFTCLYHGELIRIEGRECVLSIAVDITKRKKAEEALRRSEEMMGLIFRHSSDGINVVEVDPQTLRRRLVLCNDRYVAMSGYTREHLMGAPDIDSFVRSYDNQGRAKGICRGETVPGVPFGGMASWLRPDGAENYFEWTGCAINVDGKTLVVGVDRDVTERKLAEDKLKSANASLRANAERLRSLTLELAHVEQRERQRMAAMLHDHLQQFLVAAKLNISAMAHDPQNPTNRDYARKAIAALDEAISHSKSLAVELSPVPREGSLGRALQWLGRRMHDLHGLAVQVEAGEGDGRIDDDLRIVLFNAVRELLFNVVKHAGVKSALVKMTMAPDSQVRIVVGDQGAGFVAADAQSNAQVHGGLGLFAIRERMESLGGRLDIVSGPGQGTAITLTAPVHSAEPARGQGGPAPRTNTVRASASAGHDCCAPVRVLLVDDHVMMRQGISQLLCQAPDIQVVGEASDGEEAVRLAQETRPDVVVMDVNMPGMSGVEATRAIRAQAPGVAVIALSMYEEANCAREMQDAGAAAYITKSEAAGALVAAIHAYCCK
jgi:PAS domain S-box-containing protein